MEKYTYLLVNFFTIIICFIFSFDKRIRFDRYFITFLKSSLVVAIPFIAWDVWFAHNEIWWFNDRYLIGLRIFELPIEEWLFFICIPFSCVFTYFCLNKFFDLTWINAWNNIIVFITTIVCTVIALLHYHLTYTFVTGVVTTLTVLYLHFIVQKTWIGQASLVYTVLMLGFLPVNGILTGFGLDEPIVNYNPSQFLGIRIGTIPIEDAVYGYAQFLLNIYIFDYLTKSSPVLNFKPNKMI